MIKTLPASAEGIRDEDLIPGQEESLEEETKTHSGILAWRIPRTEDKEPSELQSMGWQRLSTARLAIST